MFKSITITIFLSLILSVCHAQMFSYCKDSTRVQSNSACSSIGYLPVCGCDTLTYNNYCFANAAGLSSSVQGICQEFALELFPNFLTPETVGSFTPIILSRNSIKANFIIMDLFGNIKVTTPVNSYFMGNYNVPEYGNSINLSELRNGMYLCILQSGNFIITKKLFIIK